MVCFSHASLLMTYCRDAGYDLYLDFHHLRYLVMFTLA